MKRPKKLAQHKINIIFAVLIGVLFLYSIFASYMAIEAYKNTQSATNSLASQLFHLTVKDSSER